MEIAARIQTGQKCYYRLTKILGSRSLFRELKNEQMYNFDLFSNPVRNGNMTVKTI